VRLPAVLDDGEAEIGVLADGVAGQPPAMSIAARRIRHMVP